MKQEVKKYVQKTHGKESVKSSQKAGRKIQQRICYETALPGPKEWVRYAAEGIGIALAVDELFYREILAVFPLFTLSVFWMIYRKRQWQRKRQEQLVMDFREALDAMAVSLRSGVSVENAIPEVYEALKRTVGNQSDMTREFAMMRADLRIGIPAEKLFLDLAERSGSEDINDFAVIFSTAKRMGGNLSGMIRKTADQIGSEIETKQEIQTILAAKKMEQKIMSLMPFGMIAYLQLTSPDYLSGLYHSIFGAIFMTACLILWLIVAVWGNSMIHIEI